MALCNVDVIVGSDSSGILSSLLGVGCECEGYGIRLVGHSLGGAIAALLGIRVWNFSPKNNVILLICLFGTRF